MNVGIHIYDQAEVLDFSGPFEVFSTAARICPAGEPFRVFLISENGGTVTARGGYRVEAHHGFGDHPKIDLLLVVGGVHGEELAKPAVMAWIGAQAAQATVVASVCTGAFLLAKARVITSENVTTHWEDIADLRAQFPDLSVHEGVRWVDEGRVVTSAGISAGIDMSLHLVERLASRELAERTARQMDFDWTREGLVCS